MFVRIYAGVPHSGEINFVFGNSKLVNNPAVRVDSGILTDVIEWTPEDALYSDYMITLWTNFAKYGSVFAVVSAGICSSRVGSLRALGDWL